jgi:hypothetical protein
MFEMNEERSSLLGASSCRFVLKMCPGLHGIREAEGPIQDLHADPGREPSHDHREFQQAIPAGGERKLLPHAPRSMRYAILSSGAAQFEGLSAEASYWLHKVGGAILGMVK